MITSIEEATLTQQQVLQNEFIEYCKFTGLQNKPFVDCAFNFFVWKGNIPEDFIIVLKELEKDYLSWICPFGISTYDINSFKLYLQDREIWIESKDRKFELNKKDYYQLLSEAKVCLDHARMWIKNMNPDFRDDGMYKFISEKIGKYLEDYNV